MNSQTTEVIQFSLDNLKSVGTGDWEKGVSLRTALESHYKRKTEWRDIVRDIKRSFTIILPKMFYIHVCIYMEGGKHDI